MKKIMIFILASLFALPLAACTENKAVTDSEVQNSVSLVVESEKEENKPVPETAESQNEKILLKLLYRPEIETENAEPEVEGVNIPYKNLVEIDAERFNDNPELKVFSEYINKSYGITVNGNWQVTVHFYDAEKTMGMVKFCYFIGNEIATNKCVTFNLNNGTADMVFYSCLSGEADEDKLQSRVKTFKEKYEQEKYQLQDGEKLETEFVFYSYFYDTDKLYYEYNVVFLNNKGVYNNDYVTACLIDKEGNAVQIN